MKKHALGSISSYLPCLVLVFAHLVLGSTYAAALSRPAKVDTKKDSDNLPQAQAIEKYGRLPLSFEQNLGQTDPRVKFLTRGRGYTLFLTRTEAVLNLSREHRKARVVKMKFMGSNPSPRMRGLSRLPGKVNYFIGADSRKWKRDIPHYAQVHQEGIYPGIDLIYYGNQRQLEYDFLVAPGADPKAIKIAFAGAVLGEINSKGNVVLGIGTGSVLLQRPLVYQIVKGRKHSIPGRYTLVAADATGRGRVSPRLGFEIGAYDVTQPLVIDPVLSYSTYLGGSLSETGASIAVDPAGNAYVTGWTLSPNFPTVNPFQQSFGGGTIANDVFITKLSPAGNAAIYSTYLGGTGEDRGRSIAVDSSGGAYITGETASTNFPVTAGSLQTSRGGLADVFVARLNPAGSSLTYSTYLGSTGDETGYGIVVHASGNASVTGRTNSSNFPTTFASFRTTHTGSFDAFISTLNNTGSLLVYSTYLGGSGGDEGHGIATDSTGNTYITGTTLSSDFPTTSGAFQTTAPGFSDAFVTKLNSAGTALVYSTYLGGVFVDEGFGIATDSSGSAYVTGRTVLSNNFPTRNAFQPSSGGFGDGFVTKLNPSGSAPDYSSFLGGNSTDDAFSIATDSFGNAYVTGRTNSTNFPTTADAIQSKLGGDNDVFVTKVSAAGTTLSYSTFLGGSFNDEAYGIAVNSSGQAYVTGLTRSMNFPTANPFQATHRGGPEDAFIAKVDTSTTQVQLTLFFPRLITSDGGPGVPDSSEYTGIAAANLGTTNGSLAFTAFDKTGTLISGTGITNPRVVELKAGEQLPIVDSQVFGSGLGSLKPLGWFKVESTIAKVVGFFLMFNSSLSFLDGADVSSGTLTSFIFPEIEDEGFTQIHIANPGPDPASITLELTGADGVRRASATRTVNPNGAVIELFTALFPGENPDGSHYIRVTSSRGVVPFEFFGKSGQYVEGLNGQDTGAGATILYSPQYVVGGPDWRSTLSIVNLDAASGNVTFEFILDDGTVIGTQQLPITARGKIYITAQEFFLSAGNTLTQGYVRITSSGPKLAGSVVFGDPARSKFSSALPLVSVLRPAAVFSQVASNVTYFTGLALLNPNESEVNALIELFDKTGTLVISKSEAIQARRRKSLLLTQYFPTLDGRDISSGYIRVTANQNIAAFALFGTHGLSVLSAIPSQTVP